MILKKKWVFAIKPRDLFDPGTYMVERDNQLWWVVLWPLYLCHAMHIPTHMHTQNKQINIKKKNQKPEQMAQW